MFQDSANEKQSDVTEPGVAVSREEWLFIFPKRNVSVHAAAVVTEDWFRHEGHRSIVPFGDIPQDVFVILHAIAHAL